MPIRERGKVWHDQDLVILPSEYTQRNSQLSLLFISYNFLHTSQPRWSGGGGVSTLSLGGMGQWVGRDEVTTGSRL